MAHCRPFDAESTGTVFGSGVGCVLLRRMEDAIADRDNIQAIIKSTAINNDGAGKVSYLAPSVDGQVAVYSEAIDIAGVDPASVTFIECHGTGTQLGDPIEIAALSEAYSSDDKNYRCAIGSVKSNIGHTDNAAGIASFIKAVKSLKYKQLAPTLHYQKPNPNIDFEGLPFYVNAELNEWESNGPRRAGVSSLGVGGTNAHVILEEVPEDITGRGAESTRPSLVMLSAKTETALNKYTADLSEFLSDQQGLTVAEVVHTLAVGRRAFDTRRIAVVNSLEHLIEVLDRLDETEVLTRTTSGTPRGVAFMFAGGGAQYPDMGRELYETEPVYKSAIDRCAELVEEFVDFNLLETLYPDAGRLEDAGKELQRPSRTLPCLFATQYATSMLWQSFGVEPTALIGHSMGENTAACLAGVLSLKDALGLVALRGQLFESLPDGGMLSVELSEAKLGEYLGDSLDVAVINAPELTVASGPTGDLEELAKKLEADGISAQRIHINVAAHSRMLEPILQEFGDYLRGISLNAPQIPIISNRTGTWLNESEATDPDYWVGHLRNTVRFADGVGQLLEGNQYVLLESGPGRVLSSVTNMHPSKTVSHTVQNSMRRPDEDASDVKYLLTAMGSLWLGNASIDWSTYFGDDPP